MEKKILLVAGETSGDMHAAHLVRELKKLSPEISFYGLGGEEMKKEGVRILTDLTQLAVVGFWEVLKNYSRFKRIFDDLLLETKKQSPQTAILIDYPGFNLRLARELKKMGIKVIYFISPQIWAWGSNRIHFIKKHVDLMLVLFKFEEILYADESFKVKFVGHPLLDSVKTTCDRRTLLSSIGFNESSKTIAFLPGSRERELENHLPVMLRAASKIYKSDPQTQFLICRAPSITREMIKKIVDTHRIDYPYKILDSGTLNGINASDLVIVASGTATLETAILNKPMIIIYKVAFLTYLLAKFFVKIRHIGLVNIVAGQKIVPELIQSEANPAKISQTALRLLNDIQETTKIHAELYALKNSLGIPGACRRAAEEINRFLTQKSER